MSEKDAENSILDYLRLRRIFCFKVENQGRFCPKRGVYLLKKGPGRLLGVSDIIGILPSGRFFAIEVKAKRGVVSENQKEFIKNITENGGLAFVARSIEDVETKLREAT